MEYLNAKSRLDKKETMIMFDMIKSAKSREELNQYFTFYSYFFFTALFLSVRVITGASFPTVLFRVTGSILKTVIVVVALYFEAMGIGEIRDRVQNSFHNHKIDFIGFLFCFLWLKLLGFISIKCFLYCCPDIEKYYNIHYFFDGVRIFFWCLPVFLVTEILSHLDHFLKYKSAGKMAFSDRRYFLFTDCTFLVLFLLMPLGTVTVQKADYLFAEYILCVAIDLMIILLYFIVGFRQYIRYRKVYTDKPDSEYTIALIIPEAIAFPNWAVLFTLRNNPFFLSDRTIGMMKKNGFSITVHNSDFREMEVEWKKTILIIPYDHLNMRYLTEWENELFKYANENNVPYLYKAVFDYNINGFMNTVRKQLYEQGNQANALRYGCYYTESFDNLINEIVSTRDKLRITEELIQMETDFRDVGMEENVFNDSLINIFNEIYYSSDCFFLCEYCIKYVEEINHFISLAFIEGFNLPISYNALRRANILNYLKTGTFGSWKDLREFLQNEYVINSKTSKTVSFFLARYNEKMAEILSMEIKEAISLVMSSINLEGNEVNDVSDLINKLVLFRNATIGHGAFTYEYSIGLAISLIKICAFLTGLFNSVIVVSTGHNLKDLGWIIEIEGEKYFAYSYYSGRNEFSYYSYKLHSVYTISNMENQSLMPIEDNLT